MSKIDVGQPTEVNAAGTDFVQQFDAPLSKGETQAASINTLTKAGAEIFKQGKLSAAAIRSKTLLEEFTAQKALDELDQQEQEAEGLLASEGRLRDELNDAPPGSLQRDNAFYRLTDIEQTKGKLERNRLAVEQGKLSMEEFRRKAERIFYEQVVHTPGLKQEIAAVMHEYLGIDPRGQEAAIEMENRKALLKNQVDTKGRIIKGMIDTGFWDPNEINDEINYQKNVDSYMKFVKENNLRQARKDSAEEIRLLSKDDRQSKAQETVENLNKLLPYSLKAMSVMGDQNLFNLSYEQIRGMNRDTRDAWMAHNDLMADKLILEIQSEAQINDQLGDRLNPLIEAVTSRRDVLNGILKQDRNTELLEQDFKRLKLHSDIIVQRDALGIFMTNDDAVRIAAFRREIGGENTLLSSTYMTKIQAQLLGGVATDLADMNPSDRDSTLSAYQTIVQAVGKVLDRGGDMDVEFIKSAALQLKTMTQHQPDELDSRTRQQLHRVTADPRFLKAMEEHSPREYKAFTRYLMDHVDAELDTMPSNFTSKGVSPDMYYLKKEGETWMLAPTQDALTVKLRPHPRQRNISKEASDKAKSDKEKQLHKAVFSLNDQRGLFTNIIKTRVNVLGSSEEQAARYLAEKVGLSLRDVKPETQTSPEETTP